MLCEQPAWSGLYRLLAGLDALLRPAPVLLLAAQLLLCLPVLALALVQCGLMALLSVVPGPGNVWHKYVVCLCDALT